MENDNRLEFKTWKESQQKHTMLEGLVEERAGEAKRAMWVGAKEALRESYHTGVDRQVDRWEEVNVKAGEKVRGEGR